MATQDCTTCKYFKPGTPLPFPGECHRFPPTQHSLDSEYSYTRVYEPSECGEYKNGPTIQ